MSWAFHLRDGIRENGHECDVVTFTRSGNPRKAWGQGNMRPGIRWWGQSPDVVGRLTEAAQILDGYDAVILTDVRTVMQDKDAASGGSYLVDAQPDYLTVLEDTSTPFTFALHGNNYPTHEVPFAERLVALPNFVGAAVTHSPTSPNLSRHLWPDVDFTESPLPYRMRTKPDDDTLAGAPYDPSVPSDVVGITGRYITTKGHHALAMTAAHGYLPRVDHVQLWGASSLSLAASATYKTFEALCLGKPLNLAGVRHGVVKPGERTETGGDVIRGYHWDVTVPDGPKVSYLGGYEDGFSTCQGLNVHVDLTAAAFSDGMEYSQFESIDAGCLQVSVGSMWSDDFTGVVINRVEQWPHESKIDDDVLRQLGSAVNASVGLTEQMRRVVVRHNREVLSRKHAPKVVASTFLNVLGVVSEKRVTKEPRTYEVAKTRVNSHGPRVRVPRQRREPVKIGVYESVPTEWQRGYFPLWHRCVGVAGKAYGRTTAKVEPAEGILDYFTGEPVEDGVVTLEPQLCMVRLQAKPGTYTVTFVANTGDTYTHEVRVTDPVTQLWMSPFRDGNEMVHQDSKYDTQLVTRKSAYRKLRIGAKVLDCGAHVGTFTRDALSRGAEVIAFEPEPLNHHLLSKNTEGFPVTRYQAAITGENHDAQTLYLADSGRGGSHSLYNAKSHQPPLQVRAYALNEVLAQFTPNTVKVSINDAERDVDWMDLTWPAETTDVAVESDLEFLTSVIDTAMTAHGFTCVSVGPPTTATRVIGIWTRESENQG
jgi:FkbM family methyltransferase